MNWYDTGNDLELGRLIRQELDAQGVVEAGDANALLQDTGQTPRWSTALETVGEVTGLPLDGSGVLRLNELVTDVKGELAKRPLDSRDLRNVIDNYQSLLVITALVSQLNGSTVDRAAVQRAYMLACPVFPCHY